MKLKSKKSQTSGFSLVEFLVVIAVLGIIGTVIYVSYYDCNPPKRIHDIRATVSEIRGDESRVLWDYRQEIPAGWHIVEPSVMEKYVNKRFAENGDRVWLISPTEVSTFKDHPDAIVHVDVRNIVAPEDKAIAVYMMSADGERVAQRWGVGLTGPTLIERDSEK